MLSNQSHFRVALLLLLVLVANCGWAAELTEGRWKGALVRENSSQLIEISFAGDGHSVSGLYSIPEMGLFEQPLREVLTSDTTVNFRILYGPFEMRYHAELGQMTGVNARWDPPLSLHLKRFPKPYVGEFRSEELVFSNGVTELAATLIRPHGEGPFPGVVVVHGSGAQGRDDWEYRSHGYAMAKRGIATLLYDKRGVGESTGDFETASFEQLADDAIAALDALRSRSDITRAALGLLGVSQGGWISAIASRKEGRPDFVILLQGPAVSLEDQELHRVEYSMRGDGFAVSSIDSAIEHTRNYFHYVNTLTAWERLIESSTASSKSAWADYVNSVSSPDDPDLTWWRNNAYDPEDDLRSIEVPVLSIFGEADMAVPVAENGALMEEYLTAAGVDFSVEVIPDMHHSVVTYQGLYGGDMWSWPDVFWNWSRRPVQLDDTIAEWIFEHTE